MIFRFEEFKLGEQLLGRAGFASEEFLMAFPNRRPDFGVVNLAFVLLFVE